MTEFTPEYGAGTGNEPTETPYENGHVIETDIVSTSYDSQDAHFAEVDRLSDQGVANYADASEMTGYDATDYELDELFALPEANTTPQPGVSVGLRERAHAVAELMDGISVSNRLTGAQRSGALGKYSNPDRVLEGMERSNSFHQSSKGRAVEVLAKTAALRAIGFNEAEVELSRTTVLRSLSQAGGTGKEAVRFRNKQKNGTARTAKKVLGS